MGDLGSNPGLGRSPGEGKGYPLQDSGLNSMGCVPWGYKEPDTTEQLSLSTREGNSFQSSDQGKKGKKLEFHQTNLMFLFLPFIMTNIFEGFLFAQHFTSRSSFNSSNTL